MSDPRAEDKFCVSCGEQIKQEAKLCKFCKSTQPMHIPVSLQDSPKRGKKKITWLVIFLVVGAIVAGVISYNSMNTVPTRPCPPACVSGDD